MFVEILYLQVESSNDGKREFQACTACLQPLQQSRVFKFHFSFGIREECALSNICMQPPTATSPDPRQRGAGEKKEEHKSRYGPNWEAQAWYDGA